MLTQEEAVKLHKAIDAMTEAPAPLEEVSEGEVIAPPIDPIPQEEAPKELTELEIQKMFRHQVPEGFDPNKVSMIRSPQTGDRVFMRYGDERRWMPDPETMERLGFTLGDVQELSDDEMKELKEGFGLLSAKLW